MKSATRILLVDDFPAIRSGVSDYLESRGDRDVIGEAGDGEQGLARLTLIREIRRLLPSVEILILTDHDSSHMRQKAQAAELVVTS